jgi:uncharacterized protein YecE (DUF72 family)
LIPARTPAARTPASDVSVSSAAGNDGGTKGLFADTARSIPRSPAACTASPIVGETRIGTSGWLYPRWRKTFYPEGLPHKRELEHIASRLNSVELNGSFYSLQRAECYLQWRASTPEGFVFAVKGSRFISHMKKLRDPENALANFFASGLLALGDKLGPILWQLPPNLGYDESRLREFFAALPKDTAGAARLAKKHDHRVKSPYLRTDEKRPIRYALEVRHDSFASEACFELLREHNVALCVADTAGKFPYLEEVTADFVYVRLHGDVQLYTSGYSDASLDRWAEKVRAWRRRRRDVFVYFDNDAKVHAPFDALSLAEKCGVKWARARRAA